ncbi:MAG: phosphodiester glycosidase family protein [Balneola sp.]
MGNGSRFLVSVILALGTVSLSWAQVSYDTVSVNQFKKGLIHYKIVESTIPWVIQVLEVDLSSNLYTLKTKKANNRLKALSRTSDITNEYFDNEGIVYAAINGDFYERFGVPTNAQVSDGLLLKKPKTWKLFDDYNGELFGLTVGGDFFIDSAKYVGFIVIDDDTLSIDKINNLPEENELAVYNQFYGDSTDVDSASIKFELVPVEGRVVNESYQATVRRKWSIDEKELLHEQGEIFSFRGELPESLESLFWGDTVIVNHKLEGLPTGIIELIGGSKRFINEGRVAGNWPDRHPRSAIGYNKDQTKFYMVVVDGRQESSAGMTLTELGEFMKSFEVHDALNLDGGGSSTLWVRNKVVNSPSDKTGERMVSNILMVIPKEE